MYLSPRFWKLPLWDWPAYWYYYPPGMLWRLWCLLPQKARWKIAHRICDLPGMCWVSIVYLALGEYPERGLSSSRCLKDGAPCYCNKYRDFAQHAADLSRAPEDPMGRVRIAFVSGGDS